MSMDFILSLVTINTRKNCRKLIKKDYMNSKCIFYKKNTLKALVEDRKYFDLIMIFNLKRKPFNKTNIYRKCFNC